MQTERRKTVVFSLWGLGLIAFFTFLTFFNAMRDVLSPFYIAAMLTAAADSFVSRLSQKKVRRKAAVFLFYLFFFTLLAIVTGLLVPQLIKSAALFLENAPGYLNGAREFLNSLPLFSGMDYSFVTSALPAGFGSLAKGAGGFLRALLFLGAGIVISIYFVLDIERIKEGAVSLIPQSYRDEARDALREVGEVLRGFVRGQLAIALILAAVVSLLLLALRIPYAPLLGLLSGFLDIIPYFGATLAFILVTLTAAFSAPDRLILAALGFLVIQQFENHLLTPRISGNSVGLHPIVIIFALLAGGRFFGFWGLLFAVPVFGAASVFLRRIFRALV